MRLRAAAYLRVLLLPAGLLAAFGRCGTVRFSGVRCPPCVGIFRLAHTSARRVTAEVHYTGIGLVGVYPYEQAEFKCDQVTSLARGRGYPLQVTYEPE